MKSQVSMQFLVMLSIVFVFFVIFVAGFAERYRDIRAEKERTAIKDLVLKVHDEIAIAHNLGDGYARNFTLPPRVEGVNYTVSLSNSFVTAVSENAEYSTAVAPVSGTLRKGSNRITKSFGVVCLGC